MTSDSRFVNPTVDDATGSIVDHAGLDVVAPEDALDLLKASPVARIAFVHDDDVVILPINIGWWEGQVVFSTQRGSKLHSAVMGRRVAIEVDGFDEATRTGWSVLAKGAASVVTDGRTIDSLDRLSVRSWVHPDVPKHWVQVRLAEVTGRRTPAADPPPAPGE